MKRVGLWCLLWVYVVGVWAVPLQMTGVRVWPTPEKTRVVFDLSQTPHYEIFTLENPARLVVDLDQATLSLSGSGPELRASGIQKIRYSHTTPKTTRVVLDLNAQRRFTHFTLSNPKAQGGHRLVIDLWPEAASEQARPPKRVAAASNPLPLKALSDRQKPLVVAIDAGHGGEDPGAIGRKGVREKEVVFSIASKVTQLISEAGMQPLMIRKGDYYVGLKQRIVFARQQGADLFISIHADSHINTTAYGASVYMLSQKGASSTAARWLADRENRADLMGGVSLSDKDAVLASVLLDLSQAASSAASLELAEDVLYHLGNVVPLHKKQVESAGFAVLKSPDIPSILVETGFLSNKKGEEQLCSPQYQAQVAKAIMKGIQAYAARRSLMIAGR